MRPITREMIQAITPEQLEVRLRQGGWLPQEELPSGTRFWGKPSAPMVVVCVMKRTDFLDYPMRVRECLRAIEDDEQLDPYEVYLSVIGRTP